MADLQETILSEVPARQRFWTNRDAHMDADMLMYLLYDEVQDQRDPGYAKFKTNWPRVAIDRSRSILIRNPERYEIPMDDSLRDDRDKKRLIERWCKGLKTDIDYRLRKTGWSLGVDGVNASHLLLRGWCCDELILSEEEQERRGSAVKYHWWDPRFVYPYWDDDGLNSVLYAVEGRLGDIALEYQDAPLEGDRDTKVKKYIWYDRTNYAVLAEYTPTGAARRRLGGSRQHVWLRAPMAHGLEEIPVYITATNQMPVVHIAQTYTVLQDPNNTGLTRLRRDRVQQTPAGIMGRSLLSAVGDAIPQFNEMMALLTQVVKTGIFGTWMVQTPNNGPVPFEVGAGAEVNTLPMGSQVQRWDPMAPPQGLNEVVTNMFREIQMGTVQGDLFAAFSQAMSGFDRAQILNVAMNSLGDFMNSLTAHSEMRMHGALRQFANKPFEMIARGYDPGRTPFEMTIAGEEIDRFYDVRVKRRLALPEDMNGRIQAARMAMDPANPILDPWTVLEEIMEVEDPDLILDKIWEFKAFTFPPVMFNVLKQALIRRGATPEQLQMVLTMEEAGQFMAEAQKLQGQGTVMQMQAALQPTGMSPSAMPPEMANSAGIEAGGPPMAGANGVPMTTR